MSITNEEKREVAENLRNMTAYGCRYYEQFYELLEETVMNEWDFHSFSDVAERLADLIKPEPERTCRNISDPPDGFLCSECRWGDFCEPSHMLTKACFAGGGILNYCPNCGCKVEH